jgi:hypothetical protein
LPDVICNTSPIQYLYQLGQLDILPRISQPIIVPTAVVAELEMGRVQGVELPDVTTLDGFEVRSPQHPLSMALAADLGPGETEVLMLGLELDDPLLILDDGLARRIARSRGLSVRGTLGVLLDAKSGGLIEIVAPLLDQLDILGFRLAAETRRVVLRMAGEEVR